MTENFKKIIGDLEEEIKELKDEHGNVLVFYEKAIELILSKIAQLKEYVLKTGFKNEQEEIHFFKYQWFVIKSYSFYDIHVVRSKCV